MCSFDVALEGIMDTPVKVGGEIGNYTEKNLFDGLEQLLIKNAQMRFHDQKCWKMD
jgi:hypothetical protein